MNAHELSDLIRIILASIAAVGALTLFAFIEGRVLGLIGILLKLAVLIWMTASLYFLISSIVLFGY